MTIALVHSSEYMRICDRVPQDREKYSLCHALLESTGVLRQVTLLEPRPCTLQQLLDAHDEDYIAAIQNAKEDEPVPEYGLEDDCAPFAGLYRYCRWVAGASLQAAAALCDTRHQVVCNLGGGRHHAHVDRASGYCFVNDIVLAIHRLLEAPSIHTVLYVDIDVHRGDGVTAHFDTGHDRVVCLDFHLSEPGFFPQEDGSSCSQTKESWRIVNVPFRRGVSAARFAAVFRALFGV